MQDLSLDLEKLRKHYGLTVRGLASNLGLPKSSVFNWECGRKPRDKDIYKKLAVYFDANILRLNGKGGSLK